MTKSSPSRLMDTRRVGAFWTDLPTSTFATDISHLRSDRTKPYICARRGHDASADHVGGRVSPLRLRGIRAHRNRRLARSPPPHSCTNEHDHAKRLRRRKCAEDRERRRRPEPLLEQQTLHAAVPGISTGNAEINRFLTVPPQAILTWLTRGENTVAGHGTAYRVGSGRGVRRHRDCEAR